MCAPRNDHTASPVTLHHPGLTNAFGFPDAFLLRGQVLRSARKDGGRLRITTRDAVTTRKRSLGVQPPVGTREASPAGVGGSPSHLRVGTPPSPGVRWAVCCLCHFMLANVTSGNGIRIPVCRGGSRGPGLVLLGGDTELYATQDTSDPTIRPGPQCWRGVGPSLNLGSAAVTWQRLPRAPNIPPPDLHGAKKAKLQTHLPCQAPHRPLQDTGGCVAHGRCSKRTRTERFKPKRMFSVSVLEAGIQKSASLG